MQRLLVKPHRAIERTIHCSFADVMIRRTIPTAGFFYRERLDTQRLADSLSRVLSDFEVYSGRFVVDKDSVSVVASQAGVIFEIDHSDQSLDDLIKAAAAQRYKRIAPQLSTSLQARGKQALMAVRITLTPDGSVLAIGWNHAIADMHSTMLMLRAWAAQYQGHPSEAPFDVEDRQAYLDERLPATPEAPPCLRVFSFGELVKTLRFAATRTQRVDLQFTEEQLSAIRTALGGNSVGRVNALVGHVFCGLRTLHESSQLSRIIMVINYRKRLGLPLDALGNIVDVMRRNVEPTEEAAEIARGLRAETDVFVTRHLSHHATGDFFRTPRGRLQRLRSLPAIVDPSGSTLIVSSWVNAGIYDLQFEATRPVFFSPLVRSPIPFMIGIAEAPDGDGLTVSMHLPKALAARILGSEGTRVLRAHPDANFAQAAHAL